MDSISLLGSLNLFESLEAEDLGALASRLETIRFEPEGVVFRHGEAGGSLFIIQEGTVDISHPSGTGSMHLATLVPGEYFGELSLFDGEPRSATAQAVTPCVLLALDRDDFIEFARKNPGSAIAIMAELARRIRQTNTALTSRVSRNVLKEEAEKLTFGQRVADRVASFGGSWTFIGAFATMMALWMAYNVVTKTAFDPYPFILLNLMLSTLAALQAPVIMMSQNRQVAKDKLLAENDYRVNLKAELGIESLFNGQAEIATRVAALEKVMRREPTSRRPGASS
jgi:CRP/FNR family cyclic AMP-dependent transcriptional regulator